MARIELFSGPGCGHCERAKALLQRRGLAWRELTIAEETNRQELLRRLPRARAVPQIFIDGRHIGGADDLEILDRDGRLAALRDG